MGEQPGHSKRYRSRSLFGLCWWIPTQGEARYVARPAGCRFGLVSRRGRVLEVDWNVAHRSNPPSLASKPPTTHHLIDLSETSMRFPFPLITITSTMPSTTHTILCDLLAALTPSVIIVTRYPFPYPPAPFHAFHTTTTTTTTTTFQADAPDLRWRTSTSPAVHGING